MIAISMDKIYEIIINGQIITKEVLLLKGYSNEEINMLLSNGLLVIKGNQYTLKSINDLYKYGVTLLLNNQFFKANKCFEVCAQLDPTHRDSYLQMFLHTLKSKKIGDALKYFEIILRISPEEYTSDNNLYRHLLNYLPSVPKEFKKSVQKQAILVDKESVAVNLEEENNIRHLIGESKLVLAMQQFNDLLSKNLVYNVKNSVTKELLSQAIYALEDIKKQLFLLASEEKYAELIMFLKEIGNLRLFTNDEYYILIITKAIINIMQTGKLPVITVESPKSINHALKGNNFEAAIVLNKRFLAKTQRSKKNDTILVLLKKICNMINEIKLSEGQIESFQLPSVESIPIDMNNEESPDRNLDDIIFFMKEGGLSLEEVICKYELTLEEILMLKIMLAKDCFSLGFEFLGNKYLSEVSSNPNVTPRVIEMLNEVKISLNLISNPDDVARKRINN